MARTEAARAQRCSGLDQNSFVLRGLRVQIRRWVRWALSGFHLGLLFAINDPNWSTSIWARIALPGLGQNSFPLRMIQIQIGRRRGNRYVIPLEFLLVFISPAKNTAI